ncbi:MAG: hypothetical protein HDR80_09630 [Bacteroides sp.]|nr:hypothetical protein [Bacteroides sp.]
MKKELLEVGSPKLADVCRKVKKCVKGIVITFTMFCMSSPAHAATNSCADTELRVKISVPAAGSSSVKLGDKLRVCLSDQLSELEVDSRSEFRALGEWTSDAPDLERRIMKVASALAKVEYKRLVIDAARGDDTFDYMLVLPDDTLIGLACTPAGLDESLVGMSVREGRELKFANVVSLHNITDLIRSFIK